MLTEVKGGLVVCRLLMGAFEAGFMAGVIYYLTTFYKRNELAFRISIFYGSATIAGAFSGLIAYGVFQINHASIPGWKFLMIVEGGATVVLAVFSFWHLPPSARDCRWFTEEERYVAEQRMLRDSSSENNEEFDLKKALRSIFYWRNVFYVAIGFSYGVASASVGNFLPQMVQRLVSHLQTCRTHDLMATGLLDGQDEPVHSRAVLRWLCGPHAHLCVFGSLPGEEHASCVWDDAHLRWIRHPHHRRHHRTQGSGVLCLFPVDFGRVYTFLHLPHLAQ